MFHAARLARLDGFVDRHRHRGREASHRVVLLLVGMPLEPQGVYPAIIYSEFLLT